MNTTDILQSIAIICACVSVIITNIMILDIKKDIRKLMDSTYLHEFIKKRFVK